MPAPKLLYLPSRQYNKRSLDRNTMEAKLILANVIAANEKGAVH